MSERLLASTIDVNGTLLLPTPLLLQDHKLGLRRTQGAPLLLFPLILRCEIFILGQLICLE